MAVQRCVWFRHRHGSPPPSLTRCALSRLPGVVVGSCFGFTLVIRFSKKISTNATLHWRRGISPCLSSPFPQLWEGVLDLFSQVGGPETILDLIVFLIYISFDKLE